MHMSGALTASSVTGVHTLWEMLYLQWQQNDGETSEARWNGQRPGDDARHRTG